jgi:hypothetical protein
VKNQVPLEHNTVGIRPETSSAIIRLFSLDLTCSGAYNHPMVEKSNLLLITGRSGLAHDLLLPTLLFAALGGMTWAVRGSSGFGASAGCIFAGVTLGTGWWFIAHEPQGKQTRRYSSGWIILAMTVAFGIAGNRGWMQWPAFWDNRLYIESQSNNFVYIDRSYGFLWLFIAGVPWAGMGCLHDCMVCVRPTHGALAMAGAAGLWHWHVLSAERCVV